jgi:hypothetical protein
VAVRKTENYYVGQNYSTPAEYIVSRNEGTEKTGSKESERKRKKLIR